MLPVQASLCLPKRKGDAKNNCDFFWKLSFFFLLLQSKTNILTTFKY